MARIHEVARLGLVPDRPGYIRCRLEYEFPSLLRSFAINLEDGLELVSSEGFREARDETIIWDGRTESPYLDLLINVSEQAAGSGLRDAGSWALCRRPLVGTSWEWVGNAVSGVDTEISLADQGVASSDGHLIYLGPYDEYKHEVSNQFLRLVVPEVVELKPDPADVLATIGAASDHLSVGCRDPEVLVVAAPKEMSTWERAGTQLGECGFWVDASVHPDGQNNTWVHEYVHTRQQFIVIDRAAWLTEGIADYYEVWLTYAEGRINFQEFHRNVETRRDRKAVLADPNRWRSPFSEYYKGRRVIGALDADIRLTSGGTRTFQDVFARMNEADDAIDLVGFLDLVTEVAGSEVANDIVEYITTSKAPSVPRDEDVFRPEPDLTPEIAEPTHRCEECGVLVDVDKTVCGECREREDVEPTCPICEIAVDSDDRHCRSCGIDLDRSCPDCGHTVLIGETCPSCGVNLVATCRICYLNWDRTKDDVGNYCESCGMELRW